MENNASKEVFGLNNLDKLTGNPVNMGSKSSQNVPSSKMNSAL